MQWEQQKQNKVPMKSMSNICFNGLPVDKNPAFFDAWKEFFNSMQLIKCDNFKSSADLVHVAFSKYKLYYQHTQSKSSFLSCL